MQGPDPLTLSSRPHINVPEPAVLGSLKTPVCFGDLGDGCAGPTGQQNPTGSWYLAEAAAVTLHKNGGRAWPVGSGQEASSYAEGRS